MSLLLCWPPEHCHVNGCTDVVGSVLVLERIALRTQRGHAVLLKKTTGTRCKHGVSPQTTLVACMGRRDPPSSASRIAPCIENPAIVPCLRGCCHNGPATRGGNQKTGPAQSRPPPSGNVCVPPRALAHTFFDGSQQG